MILTWKLKVQVHRVPWQLYLDRSVGQMQCDDASTWKWRRELIQVLRINVWNR
jgi:hypothetical protein